MHVFLHVTTRVSPAQNFFWKFNAYTNLYIFLLEIITTKQKPIGIKDNIENGWSATNPKKETSVISAAPEGYAHHATLWYLSCCLCRYKCAIKSYSVCHVHEKMMECLDNLKISSLTVDRICVNLKDNSFVWHADEPAMCCCLHGMLWS